MLQDELLGLGVVLVEVDLLGVAGEELRDDEVVLEVLLLRVLGDAELALRLSAAVRVVADRLVPQLAHHVVELLDLLLGRQRLRAHRHQARLLPRPLQVRYRLVLVHLALNTSRALTHPQPTQLGTSDFLTGFYYSIY